MLVIGEELNERVELVRARAAYGTHAAVRELVCRALDAVEVATEGGHRRVGLVEGVLADGTARVHGGGSVKEREPARRWEVGGVQSMPQSCRH